MKKFLLLILALFIIACKNEPETNNEKNFRKISSFKINVDEPSDLALSFEGDAFWTVSDDNSTIYKLSFEGEILHKIKIKYGDLEGVTVLDKNKLAIAVEEERLICIINLEGKLLKEFRLHLKGEFNKGIEGLVFNPDNQHFYLVNEKYPAMLIELDKNFDVVLEKEINFVSDLSAITYNKKTGQLWLLSDESKKVAVCDLKGNLIRKIGFDIVQAEGICLKDDNIFIVSDPKAEIYKLK